MKTFLMYATCMVAVITMTVVYMLSWKQAPESNTLIPRFDSSADPLLHSRLPLPAEDLDGRPIGSQKTIYLVYVGSCVQCNVSQIDLKGFEHSVAPVILLFDSDPAQIPAVVRKKFSGAFLLASSSLSRYLNGGWPGRYYRIENGMLEEIQKTPDDIPDAVVEVGG